jgi:hypothetical protein
MYATRQYELMQAREVELYRRAEPDQLVQAAAEARRVRTEPRWAGAERARRSP